jgi:hypothetical protein
MEAFKEGLDYNLRLHQGKGISMTETEEQVLPNEPEPVAPEEDEDDREDVSPRPEPDEEPSDPHQPPLDDDEDRVHLRQDDPRRGPEAA